MKKCAQGGGGGSRYWGCGAICRSSSRLVGQVVPTQQGGGDRSQKGVAPLTRGMQVRRAAQGRQCVGVGGSKAVVKKCAGRGEQGCVSGGEGAAVAGRIRL